MERKVRDAIKLLRASAASEGFPLDHLTDEDLLDGVARVAQIYLLAGTAPSLIAVGHRRIGYAFRDLWLAAKLERQLLFVDGLRREAALDGDSRGY